MVGDTIDQVRGKDYVPPRRNAFPLSPPAIVVPSCILKARAWRHQTTVIAGLKEYSETATVAAVDRAQELHAVGQH